MIFQAFALGAAVWLLAIGYLLFQSLGRPRIYSQFDLSCVIDPNLPPGTALIFNEIVSIEDIEYWNFPLVISRPSEKLTHLIVQPFRRM